MKTQQIIHLEMWIDDIRKLMDGVKLHGNDLEKGNALFQLTRQKIALEAELEQLKKKERR